MVDTLRLYEDLAETLDPAAARKIAAVLGSAYEEFSQAVTKADFHEVREVIGELAQAQSRTESRLEQLAQAQSRTESRLEQLAQAQSRTESRLEQLAQAQSQTESRLGELAQAQSRTESRLGELAQAQSRTESRLEQLAQAQSRTAEEMRLLARGLRTTRQMVGGLSDTVGYVLENRAIERLPAILSAEHGIAVEQGLVRRFVEYADGGMDEVNVYGRGRRNGSVLTIVGEAKIRPGKRDVDRFLKLVGRLGKQGWIEGEPFLLLIGHSIAPVVERYAQSHDIEIVPSHLLGG